MIWGILRSNQQLSVVVVLLKPLRNHSGSLEETLFPFLVNTVCNSGEGGDTVKVTSTCSQGLPNRTQPKASGVERFKNPEGPNMILLETSEILETQSSGAAVPEAPGSSWLLCRIS